jgi:hypothetical protein
MASAGNGGCCRRPPGLSTVWRRRVFEADIASHESLRSARPDAVTEKRSAVVMRDRQVSRGWSWVDQVKSVLDAPPGRCQSHIQERGNSAR